MSAITERVKSFTISRKSLSIRHFSTKNLSSKGLSSKAKRANFREKRAATLQPQPLYPKPNISLTAQIMKTAKRLGLTVTVSELVQDALKLHQKLWAASMDDELGKLGLSNKSPALPVSLVASKAVPVSSWHDKRSLKCVYVVCVNVRVCHCELLC